MNGRICRASPRKTEGPLNLSHFFLFFVVEVAAFSRSPGGSPQLNSHQNPLPGADSLSAHALISLDHAATRAEIIYRFGLLTWQPSSADLSLTACTADVRTPCNTTPSIRIPDIPKLSEARYVLLTFTLSVFFFSFFLLRPTSTPISHDIMVSRPSPGDTAPVKQRNGTRGSY